MPNELRTFFDHSRHTLWVRDLDAALDVLAFKGEERLSEPFSYTIEFTSSAHDIAVEKMLGQDARFSLYAAPKASPFVFPGYPVPEIKPLRTLNGVITGFQRLSASRDEARYAAILQPRLALLGRGRQYRLYQHKSVPDIVDHVLRTRHGFTGEDLCFDLVREYPRRLQVMQYHESDLAFISRLLAEVGIWYRFTSDERLGIDVVEFHDDQRHYLRPRLDIPCRSPSGLSSGEEDAVWGLQTRHRVVERNLFFRAYDPQNITAALTGEVDQSRGATITYGEAYHYAEPYTELGDKIDQDEEMSATDTAREAERKAAARAAELKQIKEDIDGQQLDITPIPNLKIHVCSLVAPDSPPGKFEGWMPVYIHSKLMIIDDVFTTHGSANINTRSMQGDSELNIAHEWADITRHMRRKLWNLHTAGKGAQDDPKKAFYEWGNIIEENKTRQRLAFTGAPWAPLVEFNVLSPALSDLD